jgi:hypothetical protein
MKISAMGVIRTLLKDVIEWLSVMPVFLPRLASHSVHRELHSAVEHLAVS